MSTQSPESKSPGFVVFRASDPVASDDIPLMDSEPLTDIEMNGSQALMQAGIERGHHNKVLFAAGGFSLLYAWFKSGYPLPRHSHNSDCLYYIVGGSLLMGNEELGVGDGFFVASDVPYTYVAGQEGVEILEFRACERFNIKVMANNPAFWERAIQTVEQNREHWKDEPKPSMGGVT